MPQSPNVSACSRGLTIFFSAGEPSGDLHAANLIRQLRTIAPRVRAVGYGGPQMKAAGGEVFVDLTAWAIMWFVRVLLNLHHFLRLLALADRYFRRERPDAVVLIDYPGFNWWIARRAKRHGIPVFYYTPPQIWAWGSWRVKKMRRFVDHVLCSLPFEEAWFRQRGCRAQFLGHPYFDEVRRESLDRDFLESLAARPGKLVTLLPGSRTQEVARNFPSFLRAAEQVQRQVPSARFAVAAFKPAHAEMVGQMAEGTALPLVIHVGRTPELIHAADACIAVSGSVSLELLFHARPTVVLYQIGRLAYEVQRRFRHTKYITLVNLLATDEVFPRDLTPFHPDQPDADRVLFPEYLSYGDAAPQLAAHVIGWLQDEPARQRRIAQLRTLCEKVGQPGASRRAAEYILSELGVGAASVPAPHFATRPSKTPFAPREDLRS